MAYHYVDCDRDQMFLLPASMRDWLEAGHLAWFVIDVVARINTDTFHARHPNDGAGRPAYNPDMMLALLFYAYGTGVRSSRRIEQLCHTDAAEDAAPGLFGGGVAPAELASPSSRRARLDAALARIQAQEAAAVDAVDAKAGKAHTEAAAGRKLRGRKPKDPHAALARAEADETAVRSRLGVGLA